ncbi:Flap endonuclease GEN-like protein [Dorcoceras hygrometricum]|uniref:Flap endonuclease GEN-like protein n=1 Tax=Dorcoceras hygrometricum TaxID=472368 RepID=A0A2Z7C4W0_9LAMI|nr:Flap endonuclease GEN-like protein [Dorcoceras hygrometricum]
MGILSTWELSTPLQYTIPDAYNKHHLLLLTHEMWELPTPLIAANKPIRQIEELNLPQKARSEIRRLCQQTTQWRCLRTPQQLQASFRKQYPNEASQQEESNATSIALVGAAYRWKSKKIREQSQVQASFRKQYPNEASQQEESNATSIALVGAAYRWKSKKIRRIGSDYFSNGNSTSLVAPNQVHDRFPIPSLECTIIPTRNLLARTIAAKCDGGGGGGRRKRRRGGEFAE